MRHLTLLVVLLLVAGVAMAGTVTVSWTPPTTCNDGSALTNCPTSGYKIYGALSGATKTLVASPLTAATSHVLNNVAPGNWCYEMTTLSGTQESTRSNEACKVVPAPAPNPPTISTVTTTAYNVLLDKDRFVLVPGGIVPLRTNCDPNQQPVLGYFVIPRDKVDWQGGVGRKPEVIVGKCTS